MNRFLTICILFVVSQSTCFSQYYGQYEQDRLLNDNYFKGQRKGVFIDIGAHDGRTLNNTYFFEKELGWSGICIEPLPNVFQQLKKNRNCLCVEGCISDKKGQQKFLQVAGYAEMLSGLVDKYDARHVKRIESEIAGHGGSSKEILVKSYDINQILESNKIYHVNFLSIDTEGGEFDIVSKIDFNRFLIDVIMVEDNYKDERFIPFLTNQGFQYMGHVMNQDLIFARTGFLKDNCALKQLGPTSSKKSS